ncbi:MAG: hypothetical protein AABY13_03390 [Nanoarchaeota archaeon]
MRARKAQTSIEYLVVVGMVLLASVPLFYYAVREFSATSALTSVNDAANALTNAADDVSLAGAGARRLVWITLPGGVTNTSVGGRHVSISFNVRGKETEIHTLASANLSGAIPAEQGTFRMAVEALESGGVLINAT